MAFLPPLNWVLTISCRCEGTPHCEPWPLEAGQRGGFQRDCCCWCLDQADRCLSRHRGLLPLLLPRHRLPLLCVRLWQKRHLPAVLSLSVPPHVSPVLVLTERQCCPVAPALGGPQADSGQRPMWAGLQEHWGPPAVKSKMCGFWLKGWVARTQTS